MRKLIIIITITFFLSTLLHAQSASETDQALDRMSREGEAFYVAQKAYEDGFYEVALNLFQRFLKNFPQSQEIPEINLYIAQCYFQQNKFIAALTQLERLSSEPGAEHLEDAVLYWIGEVHFRGKDFSKAISFYQRIIDEFPDSDLLVHAYYSRGWCLFELGEYYKAIEDLVK